MFGPQFDKLYAQHKTGHEMKNWDSDWDPTGNDFTDKSKQIQGEKAWIKDLGFNN